MLLPALDDHRSILYKKKWSTNIQFIFFANFMKTSNVFFILPLTLFYQKTLVYSWKIPGRYFYLPAACLRAWIDSFVPGASMPVFVVRTVKWNGTKDCSLRFLVRAVQHKRSLRNIFPVISYLFFWLQNYLFIFLKRIYLAMSTFEEHLNDVLTGTTS